MSRLNSVVRGVAFLGIASALVLCTGAAAFAQFDPADGAEYAGPLPPNAQFSSSLSPSVAQAQYYYPTTRTPGPSAGVQRASYSGGYGNETRGNGCGLDNVCGDGCGCGCSSQCCDRWYLSISDGWQRRERADDVSVPATFISFHDGFEVNAALGYRFNCLRVEVEYSLLHNEVNLAAGTEPGGFAFESPSTGNVNLRALMFNVYHDFELPNTCFRPYIGAGIGLYQADMNGVQPDYFSQIGAPLFDTPVNATSDVPFAYQLRYGLSAPVGQRSEMYIGYRYFAGDDLLFARAPLSRFPISFNPDGARLHAVEFGLRVSF